MATTPQPSPRLTENRVLAEPATVERCAQDYAAAAPDRRAVDNNIRKDAR